MAASMQWIRSPWLKIAVAVAIILGAAVYKIHENKLVIMERMCKGNIEELRKTLEIAQPLPDSQRKSNFDAKKLEFKRVFTVPTCDPKLNTSVPKDVCKYLEGSIEEHERQTYLRLLKVFSDYARKHRWTYFMFLNSLLGSWRHHDILPYGHEVDLYVNFDHRIHIVDEIDAQRRYVPKQMVHDKIRFHDEENIQGGAYYDDIGRWYTPSLNIIFYKKNATHIWRSDYPDQYVMKKSDVFPVHERPLGPLMLPAPKDTLKHLVEHFGTAGVCKRVSRFYGQTQCRAFRGYLPFVERKWENGKIVEKLVLKGKTIQEKRVDEMKDNVPLNPYTLAAERYPEKRPGFF